jgi:hypothetical protein
MRKTLFVSAALMGLALAAPVVAQEMTPDDYLAQALRYVEQHHANRAITAVNTAEAVLLQPPTPYEMRPARLVGEPQVIREVALARDAIQDGNWGQAEHYINAAMSHPSANMPSYVPPGSLSG